MRGAAPRRMKIDGWALAPSPSLPHAVVQVRRAFRRAFVKMRRRHGGEGEGSECVAGTVLEKTYVFGGFLKPPKT